MSTKNLVIYHYFEKDASYRDNLLHFLLFGVLPELDYIFVMSGNHSVQLPELPNVRYLFTAPKKSDFGGYAQLINEGLNLDSYANIFFINSSVRGPYIPPYHQQAWYEAFLEQMQGDVGMVGISICILKEDFRHSINYQARYGSQPPYSHVQTMAYVLRKEVIAQLIAAGFYREDRDATKTLAIEDYEIHLSQLVLKLGWHLRCLLPEFNGIDYRLSHTNPNPTSTVGDPNEVLGYFGRSTHPYETIFVKTNRDLYTEAYLDRLAYSMLKSNRSNSSEKLLTSPSVQGYIAKLEQQALSGEQVSDFSYLPGFIESQAFLKTALLEASSAKEQLDAILQSTSWKITVPIRTLKNWFKQ
jgi:hypothetical protein